MLLTNTPEPWLWKHVIMEQSANETFCSMADTLNNRFDCLFQGQFHFTNYFPCAVRYRVFARNPGPGWVEFNGPVRYSAEIGRESIIR